MAYFLVVLSVIMNGIG